MHKVKIIAEIANAHQGDNDKLQSLIKSAAECGADAVKFQWYKYDHLATPNYKWYKDYKKLFIPETKWSENIKLAKSLGLEVWVDVIDKWGLELAHQFKNDLDGVKLPPTILQSPEISKGIFQLNKPVLVGIGGWYDEEIDECISLFRNYSNVKITLMVGVQNYPTKTKDANLARIQYLKIRYGLEVGLADHEEAANQLAVDLPVYGYFAGATIIEKHLTLDRKKQGYDYYSSLEPEEFSLMVSKLKDAEAIMGNSTVTEAQRSYLNHSLRVVANVDIKKGEMIDLKKTANKKCPDESALMPNQIQALLPGITTETIINNQPIRLASIRKPIITIVVICRLKSIRLPQKALIPIYGVPAIERCLFNCLAVPNVDHVVLATSTLSQDDPLERFTMNGKVTIVRGDPDNVAKRMMQAVDETKADVVLRVTGDNPAVSPEILSYLIDVHLKSGADFTSPKAKQCPLGTDANVVTAQALQTLVDQPKPLTHTEYLNAYFLNNPQLFKVNIISLPKEFFYPEWRLTLDEEKDLELFEKIYSSLDIKNEPLFFNSLSNFLIRNPELRQINANVSIKWAENPSLAQEINNATRLDVDEDC